jgi:high-affinity iron transporter
MLNVLVVVWRESFEAMLVLGILWAALEQNGAGLTGKKALLGGAFAGVLLALLLGLSLLFAQTELQGAALEWFQMGMMAIAAALIVHMCLWLRAHGRLIEAQLQQAVHSALSKEDFWGVAIIATLAIGREGMETVVFLYGTGLEAAEKGQMTNLVGASAVGLLLAMATSLAVSKSLKLFNPKWFLRVSTGLLLLAAAGLVSHLAVRLIQAGVLPPLQTPAWDSRWLLDDDSALGQAVSLFTKIERKAPCSTPQGVAGGYKRAEKPEATIVAMARLEVLPRL